MLSSFKHKRHVRRISPHIVTILLIAPIKQPFVNFSYITSNLCNNTIRYMELFPFYSWGKQAQSIKRHA
jgi:hypothetical protein